MKVACEVIQEFEVPYELRGKHRRKCRACGKLIADGELVHIEQVKETKYYPVRGLMGFMRLHVWHSACRARNGGKE